MLRTLTQPAGLPMSVLEARAHVRQDSAADDSKLEAAIRACAMFAQTECQRTLVATRYKQVLDRFCRVIELPFGPVRRVVSVRYIDSAGTWQTLATAAYVVDLESLPGRITEAWGYTWPPTLPQLGTTVEVVFDAGDAVPIAVDSAANTVTVQGAWPALAVGDVLRLSNSGGALPGGLAADTDYYVQAVPSAGSYKLAATAGGAEIDITSTGTGQHYIGEVPAAVKAWMLLRIGSLFESREADAVGYSVTPMPYIDRMLDGARVESC